MRPKKKTWLFFVLALLSFTKGLEAEPTFKVRGGERPIYLWHIWDMNIAYSSKYDWESFRNEVSKLNGLDGSEEAF